LISSPSKTGNICIVSGDITTLEVDVIVTAANSDLAGGGGVDGAIHDAAGPGLLEECLGLGGCETGSVKLTGGHDLPAKFVIHAVGPVWHGGGQNEEALLASCYRRSLELAVERGARSVAFPAISCGIYGFPIVRAAEIAIGEVATFLATNNQIESVFMVAFGAETRSALESALASANGTGDAQLIVEYRPIGVVHSPFTQMKGTPIQPSRADGARGTVEVFPDFTEGLSDLDGFSHIILLCHLHRSTKSRLKVVPYLDTEPRGLFATRAPCRPNPIGLSVVRLLAIEDNVLSIENVDLLDGTPVLDIKPFVGEFDDHSDVRIGWLDAVRKRRWRADDRFSD